MSEIVYQIEQERESGVVVRREDGVYSECRNRRGTVQTLRWNTVDEARRHVEWWVRRPG